MLPNIYTFNRYLLKLLAINEFFIKSLKIYHTNWYIPKSLDFHGHGVLINKLLYFNEILDDILTSTFLNDILTYYELQSK
jgi:hypothetical protein